LVVPQKSGWRQFLAQRALGAVCLAAGFLAAVSTSSASPYGTARELEPQAYLGAAIPFAFRGSAGVGDFDGDRRADFAVAQPQGLVNGAYRYRVEVLLSAQPATAFEIDWGAPGGLHISTRDVDGDLDLDLVITSEFGRQPVGVWINDGNGRFTPGQMQKYPAFIWQETDCTYDTPETPLRPLPAFVVPANGGSAEPVRFGLPALADTKAPLVAPIENYSRKTLNSSSLLRAPPPLF
jgi:hypothetical protein